MKLVLAIVRDDDVEEVASALIDHGFYITRLASTGGFLRMGSTTLLSGVEDEQVDAMLEIIRTRAQLHVEPPTSQLAQETQVSRAVVFVLGLECLVKL